MTKPARPLTLLLLVLMPALAFAAGAFASGPSGDVSRGDVAGKVIDAQTREPLPFGNVVAYAADGSQAGGQVTDKDATFRIELPPGLYKLVFSYLGYVPATLEEVEVQAGKSAELTIRLSSQDISIPEVEVRSTVLRAGEAAVLAKQKSAEVVSDAVSAEQIAKTTDANAADALQRVSGTTVVDGRYVYVRGLGDRYSATALNGARIGSPEPNRRAVPLDLFPTGLLDNITVQKTYTPDQDGEFAGGLVQLNTRDFVNEGFILAQSASSGYSSFASGRSVLTYPGGSRDFLGFDDGTRGIPGTIERLAGHRRIAQATLGRPESGFTKEQIQAMGRSMSNVWMPRSGTTRPNVGYSGTLSQGLDVLGMKVGLLQAMTYGNSLTINSKKDNAYSGSGNNLVPRYLYDVDESVAGVRWGSISNLSLALNSSNTIKFRGLYTRSTEDRTVHSEGPNENYSTDDARLTRLDYVERGLFSGVVSGRHEIAFLHRATADWSYGYSQASRDEPDRRETRYELDPATGKLTLSNRTQYPLTRIYGAMDEFERSYDASLSIPIALLSGQESKVKVGYAGRNKDRRSEFRRFAFTLKPQGAQQIDKTLPAEQLLVPDNIKPGYFELIELTRENDSYGANQDLNAGYAMLELAVRENLHVTGGARYEDSDQHVDAASPFVTTVKPTKVRLHDTDLLPAMNLTWNVHPNANLRAAYSRTLSRPELREMSPFDMFDYETGYSEIGNIDLHTAKLRNYDLRFEVFPGARDILALSVFHKDLEDPIVKIVEASGGGYTLTPLNAENGKLNGGEIEGRFALASVWRALDRALPLPKAPGFLERWRFTANYSRVETEVVAHVAVDAEHRPVSWKGPLIGQAPSALNVALQYESGGFEGSLTYASFGRRLAQIGGGQYPNNLPDIYEYPMKSLDLVVSQQISPRFKAKLAVENLLNDRQEFRQAGYLTRSVDSGRALAFSIGMGG